MEVYGNTLGESLSARNRQNMGSTNRTWLDANWTIFPETEQTVKESESQRNTVIECEKKILPFVPVVSLYHPNGETTPTYRYYLLYIL